MSDQMKAELVIENPASRIHELLSEAIKLGFTQTGDIIYMQDKNEWVVEGIQYVLHSGDSNYPDTVKPVVVIPGYRAAYQMESLYRSGVPLEHPNKYFLLKQKVFVTEHSLRRLIISEGALKARNDQDKYNVQRAAQTSSLVETVGLLREEIDNYQAEITRLKDAERIRKARKPAKRGVRNSKK